MLPIILAVKKFESLQRPTKQHNSAEKKIQQEVHDMTKDGIDKDVKAYLSLGPDFSETPNRFPYEKIVIETEAMCKIIQDEAEKEPEKQQEIERYLSKSNSKFKKVRRF